MYHNSSHDIIKQFIESEPNFDRFVQFIKQYARVNNPKNVLEFFASNPDISKRTIDKWHLLLKRIVNDWYDICSFDKEEVKAIEEVESILEKRLLSGKRFYEGLSAP